MPAGHVSKVHKILGTVGINTGTPAPKTAESGSVSEISLSISETTCSYSDVTLSLLNSTEGEKEAGEKNLHDDVSPKLPSQRAEGVTGDGDESEIIPKGLEVPNSMAEDDASSIFRKRMSTSTITSFYDKSKVPPSISQQTSSSAIAKGPPSLSTTQPVTDEELELATKKKKPARLDFSQLLPLRPTKSPSKNLALGPDMMTKSPSLVSGATEAVPSSGMLGVGETSEKGISESPRVKAQTAEEPSCSPHGEKATTIRGLHSLYDHYEQTALRSIIGEDVEELESPVSPEQDDLDRHMSHESAGPVEADGEMLVSAQQPAANPGVEGPRGEIGNNEGGGGSPASNSSKHAQTCRASMRTDQSFSAQSDIDEISVLPLSENSDDKAPCSKPAVASSKSVSFPLEPINASRSAGSKSMAGRKQPKRMRAVTHHFFSPPPFKPPTASLPEIPKDATRRASVLAGGSLQPQRSWSRASANTISSQGSTPSRTLRIVPDPACSAAEVNNWRMSAKQVAQSRNSSSSILPQHLPQLAWSPTTRRNVHQRPHQNPTPPVSPCSSVDFTSCKESTESHGNRRYMAVTRQEEMLLCALRNKRRHMREAMLAEFMGNGVGGRSCSCHGRGISTSSGSIATPDWTTSPAGCWHKSIDSLSSSSSTTMDGPSEASRGRRRSSPTEPSSHVTFAATTISDQASLRSPFAPNVTMSPLYDQEYDFQISTSPATPAVTGEKSKSSLATPAAVVPANAFLPFGIPLFRRYSIPSPQHLSFISPVRSSSGALEAERHERVLLYLDRAAEEGKDTTGVFDCEASPDLSGWVNFCETAGPPKTPVTGLRMQKRLEIEHFSPKTTTTGLDDADSPRITDEEHILK